MLNINQNDKFNDFGSDNGRILFKVYEMTTCNGFGIVINKCLIKECKYLKDIYLNYFLLKLTKKNLFKLINLSS